MFCGLETLSVVVGAIFGILVGVSFVLLVTDRCYCHPQGKIEKE